MDIDLDPSHIFWTVFVMLWLAYIWETYLSARQHKIYKTCKTVPDVLDGILDKETFEKARLYNLDKSSFGFYNGIFSQFETTIILLVGGIPFLWNISGKLIAKYGYGEEHEIIQTLVFTILASIYSVITSFPWSLYSTFVIEEKHGFNKQTVRFFIWDQTKKFFVMQAISLPVVAALLAIIKMTGHYFFIYAWLFCVTISLILISVYADFIAPLFDKFTPLPDGELRTQIENLAAKIDFPLKKLFVVEGSKRSSHSNAYFYGFYKNKRIVLFDTLLEDYVPPKEEKKEKVDTDTDDKGEDVSATAAVDGDKGSNDDGSSDGKQDPDSSELHEEAANENKKEAAKKKTGCTNQEVLAVLSHELGHWALSHNLKNLGIVQFKLLVDFFMFGALMNIPVFYEAFGFTTRPIFVGLIIIMQFIFMPFNEIFSFGMTVLCRRFEFQADKFSSTLKQSAFLKAALIKLNKDNLGFPMCDWLYSAYHYSHPPLLERLAALDKFKEKEE